LRERLDKTQTERSLEGEVRELKELGALQEP
jgi:hypothetical protein